MIYVKAVYVKAVTIGRASIRHEDTAFKEDMPWRQACPRRKKDYTPLYLDDLQTMMAKIQSSPRFYLMSFHMHMLVKSTSSKDWKRLRPH